MNILWFVLLSAHIKRFTGLLYALHGMVESSLKPKPPKNFKTQNMPKKLLLCSEVLAKCFLYRSLPPMRFRVPANDKKKSTQPQTLQLIDWMGLGANTVKNILRKKGITYKKVSVCQSQICLERSGRLMNNNAICWTAMNILGLWNTQCKRTKRFTPWPGSAFGFGWGTYEMSDGVIKVAYGVRKGSVSPNLWFLNQIYFHIMTDIDWRFCCPPAPPRTGCCTGYLALLKF